MMYPPCFSDKIIVRPFLSNFKITNGDKYDGDTDPAIWISDCIFAIQVANGDDYHVVKHLPLMLKGLARAWLPTLPSG